MVVNFMVRSSTERGKLSNTLPDRSVAGVCTQTLASPCRGRSTDPGHWIQARIHTDYLTRKSAKNEQQKSPRHQNAVGRGFNRTPPRAAFIVGALRSGADGRFLAPCRSLLERLAQPVAGHVQTALDGADRRLELARHLLQGTALDVEGDQRGAV